MDLYHQYLTLVVCTQLKPYVAVGVKLTEGQKKEIYGKLPRGGLTGEHYFKIAPRTTTTNSVTETKSA